MAYRSGRFLRLVGCFVLVSAGCGGVTAVAPDGGGAGNVGSTGGAGTGGGADAAVEREAVTTEKGCKAVAKGLCDALDGCAPAYLKALYGDKSICAARVELGCTTDQMVPGIKRTPDDLVACSEAVGQATCADLLAGHMPAACATIPGATINGMSCGSDWQCQSTYCNKTDKCGVCGPRQAAGADCTADAGCKEGLVCANKRCVTPSGPGAACNLPNQPCRNDLYCTAKTGSGTCAAHVGAGGSCADSDDACDFVKGVICNNTSKTCDTFNIAKGGEQCGLGIKTICVGLIEPCSNILLGGVCANPAQDGEACGTAGKKCVPPANCVNGACRLPSALDCQ